MDDEENKIKLLGKIIIRGKIKTITGLHIGGGQTALNIGGIDNAVIKDSWGRPYIPGSTLKGKIRCLLERAKGIPADLFDMTKNDVKDEYKSNFTKQGINKTGDIAAIFGRGADDNKRGTGPTRFYARDAYLSENSIDDMEKKQNGFEELELDYTESKWENVIDRINSKAEHPRLTERVPKGAEFDFEFIYNMFFEEDITRFSKIIEGIALLEDDYLGGSGSRGYGQIKIIPEKVFLKNVEDYRKNNDGANVNLLSAILSRELSDITKEIKKKVEQGKCQDNNTTMGKNKDNVDCDE